MFSLDPGTGASRIGNLRKSQEFLGERKKNKVSLGFLWFLLDFV